MTAAGNLGRALRVGAGAGFAGLLVFAPLHFGSTRAGGPGIVALGCAAATLLWVASLALARRRPHVPAAAVLAVALLVLAALPWITGLAQPTPVAPFTQAHFERVAARWPSSIVWRTPGNTLALTLALAASVLALTDLARGRAWALTFALALTATAAAVGLLALLQNHTHATGIYWRNDGRMPGNFCGTFFHHTSAGAYFNTAWPPALALACLAWNRRAPVLAIPSTLAVILLLAAHGSHVSRFPQVAALVVAPFLLVGLKIKFRGPRTVWIVAAGAAAVVALVALAGRTDTIGARWQLLFAAPRSAAAAPVNPPESAWPALVRDDLLIPGASRSGWFGDRGEGWRTALRAIAARPLTGHGPGNWMGAASRHSDDPFVRTFYQFLQFAHQDPLQTAVEWGVPAALAAWALPAVALLAVLRARRWCSPLHRALALSAACALAALLLQAQLDFPLQMPAIALNAAALAALCLAGVRAAAPRSAA